MVHIEIQTYKMKFRLSALMDCVHKVPGHPFNIFTVYPGNLKFSKHPFSPPEALRAENINF
jgi:hypothetical protein